jgi:hypothetical protein
MKKLQHPKLDDLIQKAYSAEKAAAFDLSEPCGFSKK